MVVPVPVTVPVKGYMCGVLLVLWAVVSVGEGVRRSKADGEIVCVGNGVCMAEATHHGVVEVVE